MNTLAGQKILKAMWKLSEEPIVNLSFSGYKKLTDKIFIFCVDDEFINECKIKPIQYYLMNID